MSRSLISSPDVQGLAAGFGALIFLLPYAASAQVVEPVPVREPPADPGVVMGTDELVPVRALSSLPPIRSAPMIL
jgi:hypothetical protein